MKQALLIIAAFALVAAAPGTSAKPSDLRANITNPYWPMKPGTRWVYREGARKKNVVTVLPGTKRILGFETRAVHDIVDENGKLKEDTEDWYAQDRKGNVWYMGEATKEYSGGQAARKGRGAQA